MSLPITKKTNHSVATTRQAEQKEEAQAPYLTNRLQLFPDRANIGDGPEKMVWNYLSSYDQTNAASTNHAFRAASLNYSETAFVIEGQDVEQSLSRYLRSDPTKKDDLVPNKNIKNLDISGGIFKSRIISIETLKFIVKYFPNLESLNISYTNLTDEGIAVLTSGLKKLKDLNLESCWQITDTGVALLSRFENLKKLNLSGSTTWGKESLITDKSLFMIATFLPQLESLILTHCQKISDKGIAYLSSLKQLKILNLWDCTHITDESLNTIKTSLKTLESLNLGLCNNITDQGLAGIEELKELKKLTLDRCSQLTDEALRYLTRNTQLNYLDVKRCSNITNKGLSYTAALKELEHLHLTGCEHITKEGVIGLQKELKKIERICLGKTAILKDDLLELKLSFGEKVHIMFL